MRMKKVGIIIVLFLIADISFCDELNKVFKAGNKITINLPSGWVSIPEPILSDVNSGKPRNQKWDYAYQLNNSGNWFVYPYILVRVTNTGKVPATAFAEYRRPLNENDNEELNKSSTEKVDYIGIIEKHFNDSAATLFSTARVNVQGIGIVIFKSALIFTEKGLIEIGCYINEAASEEYMPVFDKILKGIKLDESLKYNATNESSLLQMFFSKSKHILNMVIGASIALLILNIVGKKKKHG